MILRAAAALFLLALVSCREERAIPVAPRAVDGGQVVRRLESDVSTLNYLLQTTEYERDVLSYLYDPLIAVDENLLPIAGTAAKWEVSADGLTWTLHLDPRATFSDGRPVRASDVVFTLRKAIEAESMQFSGFLSGLDLEKTKAIDDRTVSVVFNEPLASRWYAFNIGVLPEHVYGKGDFKTAFNDTVVGNGPYRLAGRDRGKGLTLERRKDYWREAPAIDRVVFKVIKDQQTAWNALLRGDIDETRVKTDAWVNASKDPQAAKNIRFVDVFILSYNCFAWNNDDPTLSDPRVRRALSLSFDRDNVIRSLYHGQARPVTGPFTPGQWAHNDTVQPVPFNIAAAGALLDAAGWRDANGDGVRDRDGKPLTIEMLVPAGNSQGVEQSQLLQQSVKAAGVDLQVRTVESATFFEQVMGGKYQGAFFAWNLDADPDPFSLFHSKQVPPAGLNVVRYRNPAADSLMEEARREMDVAARRDRYHRLHEVISADQPYTWTVQVAQKWAVSRRIENVESSKGFGLFLWHPGPLQWRIRQQTSPATR